MNDNLPYLVRRMVLFVARFFAFPFHTLSLLKNHLALFNVAFVPLVAFCLTVIGAGITLPIIFLSHQSTQQTPHFVKSNGKDVLGAATIASPLKLSGTIVFNVPGEFDQDLTVNGTTTLNGSVIIKGKQLDLGDGTITASNVVYNLKAGDGLSVTGTQTPTITNTGVLSLQGATGAVTLTAGNGISINGTTISNTLSAPSAPNSFTTITDGTNSFSAGSSSDTLTFSAGSGITLTTDTTNKKITIAGGAGSGVTSLAGTANQVLVNGVTTAQTGAVTLTLPQSIGPTSAPTFAGITSSGTITFSNLGSGVVKAASGVLSASAVNLASGDVAGVLGVSNGGTGANILTQNGVLYGNGTSAVQTTASGAANQVLAVNGQGVPTWMTLSAGGSGTCSNCLSSSPTTTQTIQPTGNVTGLTISQTSASSPSADIFSVTNSTGTVKFLQIDANGNVILNNNDLQLGGNINMKTDDTNLSNIVDTFVYDTSADVDSGAWTNNGNAQASSWYNETMAPTANCVLGQSGRCGTRPFPKKVIIVVRTTNVYIYDAQNDTLWMMLSTGSGLALGNTTLSSVFALNGSLYVGTGSTGLVQFDFINDKIFRFDYNAGSGGRAQFLGSLSQRNSNLGYEARQSWGQIAADKVNGVFVRVINGKTYIAVSTLGGANVIDLTDQRVVRYIDN